MNTPETIEDRIPKEVRDALDEFAKLATRKREIELELNPMTARMSQLEKIITNWLQDNNGV